MNIDLTRTDLIAMVKGLSPSYTAMKLLKQYGTYVGGFKDDWNWNHGESSFDGLTEQEIFNLYKEIRDMK